MDARISNEFDVGFTWVVEEQMERASHAVAHDGRCWLIDPVDWAPALERAATLGEPAGVVQLLDRHNRDSAEIAHRLGVPLLRLPRELPDSPFEVTKLIDRPWWKEDVLWWPERQLLIVPEAVGTSRFFALGRPLGVHPLLRITPPFSLRCFKPRSILVGHGASLHDDAASALDQAVENARADIVRGLAMLPRALRRHRD
ncbi:hypothetical protein Q5424_20145 [Conexibacter sp. JD483]|uniref:hypothetical protein n=1 Tax=unclassified Conexibacter TaxID=2627773 RepID=UPI0027198A38|nr:MULTISPECIES: hypothetical protein [unclassified Conexibacter]MDO8188947.1 hypothetical protein [Conexibacter sp. CPCC 205706]MDO8201738.1 hypothetical protein [Conexibacter sp. CPCC 205762]MDR9371421.1 hypothetical protein [Conexibacter sp. JD483]